MTLTAQDIEALERNADGQFGDYMPVSVRAVAELLALAKRSLSPPGDVVEAVEKVIEPILVHRVLTSRMDGYTIEAAKEIAQAALSAIPRPSREEIARLTADDILKLK